MFTDENAQAAGSYLLGFMCMTINTDESLNDLNIVLRDNKRVMSTFLHEYIHYLQNFTSTSGLYSSGHYTQLVKYAVDQVKNNVATSIELPLKVDHNHNRLAIHELNVIYRGDSQPIRRVIYNDKFSFEETITPKVGEPIRPFRYVVNLTCVDTRKQINYNFGITALKEFVAHTIQNKFLEIEHPDAPYLLVDLIINKELPNFTDDNLKIVLCDACLMHYHPGELFFGIIDKLQQVGDMYPKDPKEFYDFLFEGVSLSGLIGNFDNVNDLFSETFDSAEKDYDNLFGSYIFEKELKWIKHILAEARKIRLENPTFLLDLVDGDGNLTREFKRIFENLGTPFFLNIKKEAGLVPPTDMLQDPPDQPYLLYTASIVLEQIYGDSGRCSMYEFCKKSNKSKDLTDDNCQKNPFLKMNDSELCPFGQLTKTWGLSALNLQR